MFNFVKRILGKNTKDTNKSVNDFFTLNSFTADNTNNNTGVFEEPETVATINLKNSQKDQRKSTLYKRHRFMLKNQWINPLQGINAGLGTANLSFFNYQPVNYTECGMIAQDPPDE